jgi:hypothetical protein
MQTSDSYQVQMKDTGFFRVSEEVIEEDVAALAARIAADNCWIAPISVERNTGIIMDGNHRWHAGVRLGLAQLPCILLDYADPRVTCYEWTVDECFDIDSIFRVIMGGQVFPYKTTRHLFSPPLPRTAIALADLLEPVQKFG